VFAAKAIDWWTEEKVPLSCTVWWIEDRYGRRVIWCDDYTGFRCSRRCKLQLPTPYWIAHGVCSSTRSPPGHEKPMGGLLRWSWEIEPTDCETDAKIWWCNSGELHLFRQFDCYQNRVYRTVSACRCTVIIFSGRCNINCDVCVFLQRWMREIKEGWAINIRMFSFLRRQNRSFWGSYLIVHL